MGEARELNPVHLLSDEPIDGDAPDDLGRDQDARLLAEIVLGTRGPFTVGVYGDWGVGKTSLLNRIRMLLETKEEACPTGLKHPYVVPVAFDAWQYEREAEPLAHLTSAIHDAVSARLKAAQSLTDAASEKAIAWLRSVHLATRAAVYGVSLEASLEPVNELTGSGRGGLLKYVPFLKLNAKDSIDRYEKLLDEQRNAKSKAWKRQVEESATIAALRSLRADTSLLEEIRPGIERRIPRVVVFVDDMDRCAAKDAFKVLHGIKLALAQPGFVFVLSLNPDTLRPFIAQHAKDGGRDLRDLTEAIYLDKLVQLPYPLRLRDEQFQEFAKTLVEIRLKDLMPVEEHEIFMRLRPCLRDSSDQNPRTLKRRINAVIVDGRLAPRGLLERLDPDPRRARASFMGLCLLEQTARHFGGPDLMARLAAEDALCSLIQRRGLRRAYRRLAGLQTDEQRRGSLPKEGLQARAATNPEDATILKYADLLTALNAVTSLDGLLQEDFGARWLVEPYLRAEFAGFIAVRPNSIQLPALPAEGTDEGAVPPVGRETPSTEPVPSSRAEIHPEPSSPRRSVPRQVRSSATPSTELLAQRAIIERAVRESLNIDESKDLTASDWSRVDALVLGGEEVSDVGVVWLARPDGGLSALTTLYLWRTEVTDAGVKELTRPDTGLKTLTTLELGSTRVTDAGVEDLARPDTGLKALTSLELGSTHVTDAGLMALSRPDTPLTALTRLYLGNTQITDAGVVALARPDTGLKALATLYLGNTQVTDAGMIALARPDTGLKGLAELYLAGTKVTDAGVMALARPDADLKALTELNVGGTSVTEAAVRAVEKRWSGIKVTR